MPGTEQINNLLKLIDLNVVQSNRAYQPMDVSHYTAPWIPEYKEFKKPAWPGMMSDGQFWDRAQLEKHYAPWIALAKQGNGVHCGVAS